VTAASGTPLLRALVAAQLAFLAVAAIVVAFSFSHFTQDERAHFSYVESMARDLTIPTVGRELISPATEALHEGTYPAPGRLDPAKQGLGGQSYEGFQPPLYYTVAAPVFRVAGGDYRVKQRLLRLLNVVLLLGTAALLWRFARRVADDNEDPLALYALGLTVLLWPGLVMRAVSISSAGLELLLGVGIALFAWDTWERRDPRRLLLLAVLLGAGLLTRVSLVAFAPTVAIVAFDVLRRSALPAARRLALGAGVAAIPVVLLAPWLAHNLHTYHSLTAQAAVRDLQEPFLNPTGRQFGYDDVVQGFRALSRGVLPEEWWVKFLSEPWRIAGYLLGGALLVVVVAGLTRMPRPRAGRLAVVAVLPVAGGLVWMLYAMLASNWDFFLPRYLYPQLVVFGLLAAVSVRRLAGPGHAVPIAAASLTGILAALWIYLAATVTPFTG